MRPLACAARCGFTGLILTFHALVGAQPPESTPSQSPSTPPPAPARHEPEATGPFARVMSGTLRPKTDSDTQFVIFSAFRGLRGCARDEFSAVRIMVNNSREEGCLQLAVSDRRELQIRWADGRVIRYHEAEWTLTTGLR